jgi:hypothetical protein
MEERKTSITQPVDAKGETTYLISDSTKPKDTTSFTQALYDMLSLRMLDLNWLPTKLVHKETSNPENPQEVQDEAQAAMIQASNVEPESDVSPDCDGPEHDFLDRRQEEAAPPSSLSYSLTRLTKSHLQWLASPSRADDPGYHSHFVPFMKQTLVYCLNDPEQLMNTAKHVQQDSGLETRALLDRQGEPLRTEEKEKISEETPSSWPTINLKTERELDALCLGFSYFEGCNQRDVIMASIFNALQHSYALPPWLLSRRSERHSRSSSGTIENISKRPQSSETDGLEASRQYAKILGLWEEKNSTLRPLEDVQVIDLCFVVLLFLTVTVFGDLESVTDNGLVQCLSIEVASLKESRNHGRTYAPAFQDLLVDPRPTINLIDILEDLPVHRSISALMDVVSHRLSIAKWAGTLKSSKGSVPKSANIVESLVSRMEVLDLNNPAIHIPSWLGLSTIELARHVLLKDWDRSAIVQRIGSVGGALELLAGLYRERQRLGMPASLFWMPFIAERFDGMSMPVEWLSFRADNRQMHVLSFSFLFEPRILVKYFRAINIATMRKSHEEAAAVYSETRHHIWPPTASAPVPGAKEVLTHLRPYMAQFFVLTIRRDNILNDAIDQIWRRQKRELMRPLRVRLGKDEGEDGLDHGGVQQEFFRLVFAEAFRPDYGMFTVDPTTRMTWFQPGSFEPLYRFEALGILMSLAVYNGITLPLTFPLAFYRKLLGLKVKKLDQITDGWPALSNGLKSLLDWSEGDVGDVIARTYEFSYEICGSTVTVDMQKVGRDDPWPLSQAKPSRKGKEKSKSTSFELPLESTLTPPSQPSPGLGPSALPISAPILSRTSSIEVKGISTPLSIDSADLLDSPATEEAALVTNANRHQYVKDYVLWLTHKSIEPQFEAFASGFFTCIDRTALSIFNPEALRSLVEGSTEIDIDDLEFKCATYDDYTASDPTIQDFWRVVRSMSPDQHRQLLEFVTASDRVPVNGMSSVTFIIQKNGEDDTRLPSSSTCYGRLLLPQYSSRQVLEEKLTKAIENSVGFGTL